MTVWQLRDASGTLRPELYAQQWDALGEADHGDEAEEVETDRHTVAILAPWILDE